MSGKNRFKAAVRQVIENRPWLEDVEEIGDISDDVRKNIKLIGQQKKRELLSLAEKSILRRDARLRTEEEKEKLHKAIGHIKCFRRYPEEVTKQLVGNTYFVYYGPNRVIGRQGREATFLGFVVKGRCIAYQTREDPLLSKPVTEVHHYIEPGQMFGEIPLLYNVKRLYTTVTETATELLMLKKDDFAKVLQASMQKQWDEVQEALTHFPYFSSWSELARRECCLVSEIMNYKPQEVILGENVGKKTSAHFVLNGSCRMIQKLVLRKKGGNKYELHPDQQSDCKGGDGSHCVYMQLCLFTKGGSFGLGENLNGRLLVASSDVRLLRIPMYLLRQQNVANIWLRIKQFLDSRIPTKEELFQRFVEEKEWAAYRKHLCEALRKKQIPNNTTIHDAPYYWRVKKMESSEIIIEDRGRKFKKHCNKTEDLYEGKEAEEKRKACSITGVSANTTSTSDPAYSLRLSLKGSVRNRQETISNKSLGKVTGDSSDLCCVRTIKK